MKISRKDFIFKSLAYGISPYLISNLQSQNKKKKVLVLGGGLSGLYAASQLEQLGYAVHIVEATNILGGRIQTTSVQFSEKNISLEFGAEYISSSHTQILSLAKKNNLELVKRISIDKIFSKNKISTLTEKNYYLNTQSLEKLNIFFDALKNLTQKQLEGLDQITLYSYLKYQNFPTTDLENINLFCLKNYGESIYYLSAQKTLLDMKSFSPYTYKVKLGMKELIQILTKNKNFSYTFLDPVIKVEQNSKEVVVSLKSNKKLKADLCICSLPFNQVLQIQWQPVLKRDKRFALLKLKYSKNFRSYFFLDKVISNTNFSFIDDFYLNKIKQKSIINQMSSLLCVDYYNQMGRVFQKMSVKGKNALLQLILKEMNLTKENFQILQSYHTQSKYSNYIPTGKSIFTTNTLYVQKTLKEPEGRVFFVGEHLGKKNGTMEGALDSVDSALRKI